MPLSLSLGSELAKRLLKLMLETVQMARQTTCLVKCHALSGNEIPVAIRPV